MKRREFIAGLGAATAWPLAARAQQAVPVVGYLSFGSPGEGVGGVTAFLQGLATAGYVEGRDVAVEFRWANHQGRQLLSLATELVQRQVAMIVALDGGPSALAAQSATSTIPILFLLGADPAKFGFVVGGNMTGLTAVSSELMGKRLDLLREMNPLATTVAYLIDPRAQDSEEPTRAMVAAARALGRQAVILELFIGGKSDWGVFQAPGAFERMQSSACTQMRGAHLIDGAGHWLEQEQPEQVSGLIVQFLKSVG